MWKDMSKGEITFIYIIWLISALVFTFGIFNLFGIGKDAIDSVLPASVVQDAGADSPLNDVIDTAKDTVLSQVGGDTSKILLGVIAYIVLATLIFILVGKAKNRVWGIYFFGIVLHLLVGIVLIVSTLNLFQAP